MGFEPVVRREKNVAAGVELVPFYQDQIEAIRGQDGEGYVVVRRICENLGIAYVPQYRKLQDCPWACITMMVTHDPTGRDQQTCVLPIRSVPMWLATIHANKVAPEVREKLVKYQLEARDVLARHFGFLPSVPSPVPTENPLVMQARLLLATVERLDSQELAQRELSHAQQEQQRKLIALEANQAKVAQHSRELEQELADTHRRMLQIARNTDAAFAAATGQSTWCPLTPWARRHGVKLKGNVARQEGRIVAALSREKGIEPGRCPRGAGQPPVGTYPPEILREWLDGWHTRQRAKQPLLLVGT